MAAEVELTGGSLDAAAEYDRFSSNAANEGAIASFAGIARPSTVDGDTVATLFLDHHPRLTLASMQEIATAARERFPIQRLRIVHRHGAVAPGEAIVFVAAAAAHRRAALEAVDYMMDRLKTDAVFWKREERNDGGEWIEPTDADRQARSRWGTDRGGN